MYSLRDMGILGSESLAMERSSSRGGEEHLRSLNSERRVVVSLAVARRAGLGIAGCGALAWQFNLSVLEMLDLM